MTVSRVSRMFAIVSEHASTRMSLCRRLNDFTDTEVTTRAAKLQSAHHHHPNPIVLSDIFYSFFPQCKLPNVLLNPVSFPPHAKQAPPEN